MAEMTPDMTPRLRDVFDSWYSELIEERYTHPDVQCDACLQVFSFFLEERNIRIWLIFTAAGYWSSSPLQQLRRLRLMLVVLPIQT